jgi:uncharacterized membrane protein
MMPEERPILEGTRFPYLKLAVVVLGLYAILAVVLPPNPYRSAVAIAAFFAMGYSTLALVAGEKLRLSAAEVLGFTSIIGIPITEFAVIIIGLPIGVVASLQRRQRGRPWAALTDFVRRLFDFSDYSTAEKGIAAVLLAGIMGSLVFLLSLSGVMYPDQLSPVIAITGRDGTPDSLPSSFLVGQAQNITITVLAGSNAASYVVQIRLIPKNATGNESFHPASQISPLRLDPFAEYREPISLGPGTNWTKPFMIIIDAPGNFDLRFDLLDASLTVLASSKLPIVAT